MSNPCGEDVKFQRSKCQICAVKVSNSVRNIRADIMLHKAAKKYFDEQGFKTKLPSINTLKAEWGALEKERRELSPRYKPTKEKYLSLCTAKANADVMLFGARQPQKSHDSDAR